MKQTAIVMKVFVYKSREQNYLIYVYQSIWFFFFPDHEVGIILKSSMLEWKQINLQDALFINYIIILYNNNYIIYKESLI